MRKDLHGSTPDKCAVALLLFDVINDLKPPEGELIERAALEKHNRVNA